jgi:hypothetical protein
VVHLVLGALPCIRSRYCHPLNRSCIASSRRQIRDDRGWEDYLWDWNCNVSTARQTICLFPDGNHSIGTNLAAYQAEVSSPEIRGRVVSFVQLSYQIGVLVAYCVGLGTVKIPGNSSWRVATALQVVPGIVLIVASFTIPESPRWLLERYPDKPERALKQLSKIRKLPENDGEVQEEYLDLIAAREYRIKHEGEYSWRRFFSKYAIWKRIAYGMATMALGQISGVGALMLYGILIFEGLGFSAGTMSLLLNVVSGLLCLG